MQGLRVLLTGGSSGVGRALAIELAARGAAVFATARRGELLATLAADGRIASLAGDLTSADFRRELVAAAVKKLGGIDIVVAAAGSGAIGRFADADPATLRQVMEIDFFASAELVRLALPELFKSPDPAIVLVGSILGLHPLPLHADYCAAKAALHALAGTLRAELAPSGIDVLLATLGPTASEFWDSLLVGDRPAWSRGRQLDADTTARAIIAALERRRGTVYPGWSAKGFALAARFCPRLIDRIIRRRMARS
jgi:short-subunit dehydrogenase